MRNLLAAILLGLFSSNLLANKAQLITAIESNTFMYICGARILETPQLISGGVFFKAQLADGSGITVSGQKGEVSGANLPPSKGIIDLDIVLGAEYYGASYAVDVCYNAPTPNISSSQYNGFSLTSDYELGFETMMPFNYVRLSGLEVNARMRCRQAFSNGLSTIRGFWPSATTFSGIFQYQGMKNLYGLSGHLENCRTTYIFAESKLRKKRIKQETIRIQVNTLIEPTYY